MPLRTARAIGAALTDAVRLAKPYFGSAERRTAWALLSAIIALNLVMVYLNVVYTYWYKVAYDALQTKTASAFWQSMFTYRIVHGFPYVVPGFTEIALLIILAGVYAFYLNQMLEIRWRRWLTANVVQTWLGDRMYYRLGLGTAASGTPDNPDQRISEDIPVFVSSTLTLGISLLSNVVTLIAFTGVLWSIAPPLAIGHVHVPGYLVWAALIYSIAGSVLAQRIGRPLIGLTVAQQRVNADFRFNLVRIREHTEQIALSQGEAQETAGLTERFESIYRNWWSIMKRTKMLNFFTIGFTQVALIFPLIVAAPGYFSGIFTLGVMLQIASIFGNVQGALSWFVGSYQDVVTWRATVARLTGFERAIEATRSATGSPDVAAMPAGTAVSAQQLAIDLPDGRPLLDIASLHIEPGAPVIVSGPSGSGKSTLFRVLAGIWPFARGRVTLPAGTLLFLPQQPYVPIGTVRDAVTYPATDGAVSDAAVREALERVGLTGLSADLQRAGGWERALSGGERQRLALARALVNAPDWLFLDEALSALDDAAAEQLLDVLERSLPRTQIVLITHSERITRQYRRRATLSTGGDGAARLRFDVPQYGPV